LLTVGNNLEVESNRKPESSKILVAYIGWSSCNATALIEAA